MLRLLVCCGGILFAGCATAPLELSSASPASPSAPEGACVPRQGSLRADEVSRKTTAMLAAAQKQQAQWDAHGPVSGPPEDNNKPERKHEPQ